MKLRRAAAVAVLRSLRGGPGSDLHDDDALQAYESTDTGEGGSAESAASEASTLAQACEVVASATDEDRYGARELADLGWQQLLNLCVTFSVLPSAPVAQFCGRDPGRLHVPHTGRQLLGGREPGGGGRAYRRGGQQRRP